MSNRPWYVILDCEDGPELYGPFETYDGSVGWLDTLERETDRTWKAEHTQAISPRSRLDDVAEAKR